MKNYLIVVNLTMDINEIKTVDIVYRSYYRAYPKNEMLGIYDVAKENNLTNDEVEKSILFLEGENQIEFSNKGFDPINSGAVYKLTKQGYAWFAKTCYVDELINKPVMPVSSTTNHIYGGNNQIGNHNNQENTKQEHEGFFAKHSTAIIIAVIDGSFRILPQMEARSVLYSSLAIVQ